MNYPLISEYIESIMCAEDNFATLTNLRPVLDENGDPVISSGNFAVVFKMQDIETRKEYALKCFTKDQNGRTEAYTKISEFLKKVNTVYIAKFQYYNNELFVDSNSCTNDVFPVVLMDWVSGITLNNYVEKYKNDVFILSSLLQEYKDLLVWLIDRPFAHGDLKPDNIIVTEKGKLVLVDYDGMYVPSMKGENAREIGSPDFRNPHKEKEVFDENIDLFPLLSIYLSLSVITYDSETLNKFGSSDRLLFSEKDYFDFEKSRVFQYINYTFSSGGKIGLLTCIFKQFCEFGVTNSSFNPYLNEVYKHIVGKEFVWASPKNLIIKIIARGEEFSMNGHSKLPNAETYINLLQNYKFSLKKLSRYEPVFINNHLVYIKGTNSVVFKMYDKLTRKFYALKCYTDLEYGIIDRLKVISNFLRKTESSFIVKMQIIDKGLCINYRSHIVGETGYYLPVVIMEWVEGLTLKQYVNQSNLSEKDFEKTVRSFKNLVIWLLNQDFSHGDLSPQNVIATDNQEVKLIDYDNMIFRQERDVPKRFNQLRDKDFRCVGLTSKESCDNIDNFAIVSIMTSLIYRLKTLSNKRNIYSSSYSFFFEKNDFDNIENNHLFKSINTCYSSDYNLSDFVLCFKQHLRAVVFSKKEILYLLKEQLIQPEKAHRLWHEGKNGKMEKILLKCLSGFSIIAFVAPFLLLSYTRVSLLGVSACLFAASIILFFILFVCASFRPDKSSRLDLSDDDYIGFVFLGFFATFIPVLLMSDFIPNVINKHINWLHIPLYDEPWYITVCIWSLFALTYQTLIMTFENKIYDYDTLVFDIQNHIYKNKREKFIRNMHENEYNYAYSTKINDSRLNLLSAICGLMLIGIVYVMYCFLFKGIDLIFSNIIIALLTLGYTVIKSVLKDHDSCHSHKAIRRYNYILAARMIIPLLTIPFAFSSVTNYLNSTFNLVLPSYNLGVKEFWGNALLYLFIFFWPINTEDKI